MAENVQQPTNGNVSQNLVSGLSTPMVNSMEAIQQEIATTNRLLNIIIGRGLGGGGQTSQQAAGAWGGSGPPAGQTVSNNLPPAASGNPPVGQTVAAGGPGGGTTTSSGGGGKKKNKSGGGSSGGSDGTFEGTMRQLPIIKWGFAATDEIVAQRNKNMQYQSVEGNTNVQGFGERSREETYRFSTMGMFSSQEARTAFKGVTSLGYNEASKNAPGAGRQEALDFIYKGKSEYGQSVEEGLSALQSASRAANISFQQLSTSLGDVAKTAGAAGVNAKVAREQFINAMDAAVSSGYGSGSVTAAQVATKTVASYGRASQQNTDITGQFSNTQTYLIAAQSGLSQPQARQIQRSDQPRWQKYRQKYVDTVMGNLGTAFVSAVKSKVQKEGGKEKIRGDEKLAADIGYEAAAETNTNTEAITNVATNLTGIQYTSEETAMAAIVYNIAGLGQGEVSVDVEKSGATYDTKTGLITEGEYKGQKSTAGEATAPEGDGKKDTVTAGDAAAAAGGNSGAGWIPKDDGEESWRGDPKKTWGIIPRDTGGEVNAAYDDVYTKNNKSNPTIKALLKNLRARGLDPEKMHVEIGGRVYTIAESIRKFPELIAAGKIKFLDGGIEGETTGDVAGSSAAVDRNTEKKLEANAKEGTGVSGTYDPDQWQKEHGQDYTGNKDNNSGGGGKLELTPDAKKLVKYLDNSGGNYPPSEG